MSKKEYEAALSEIMKHVERSIEEHTYDTGIDSLLYNGGTIAVILATAIAAFWPDLEGPQAWLPRVLTGFAGFWVALERALNFGARWRFHLEMKNGYRIIRDRIVALELVPEDERLVYLESIRHELFALRRRESAIPGAGGAVTLPEEQST